VLAALALRAALALHAGFQEAAPPEAERADLASRIDPIFATWDRPDSPGCALGVFRAGEVVYARGYGCANLEHGIPIAPSTVFDLGSTSKQFTAASVVLLALDGKLSLEDDVRKWIPEIPDYGRPIRIRHLLHHTSGLRDYLTLFALAGIPSEDWTDASDALAILSRQKALNFDPGEERLYSNSGYFLLSVIVERISGKSLVELAKERIFDPLGMSRTHFHDDHRLVVPGRATAYGAREGGGFGIEMSDFEQTGDGAVMSTVEDLARWDANFYTGKVGGKALVEMLRTPGRLNDGKPLDYALGLGLGRSGALAFEAHGGSWAGYRAQMLRIPERRLTVVVLANLAEIDPSDLAWKVAAVMLPGELKRDPESRPASRPGAQGEGAPADLSAEEAASIAGLYESEELAVVYEIAREGGGLVVRLRGRGKALPLVPEARDRFRVLEARLEFDRDEAGRARRLVVSAGRVRNIAFERR
jgi:CubicO group peptidase (beta-lactamase class C family)